MADNLDSKCNKCWENFKGRNHKSICCSNCNKWVHFKCSNLSKEEFINHNNDETLIWRCECCTIHRCKKCIRVIGKGNSIFCDCCNKWTHLKCSGLSKDVFCILGKSKEKWICKICKIENLPFMNIDDRKLKTLIKSKIPLPPEIVVYEQTCRVAKKK